MALVRWEPVRELHTIQNEMNRLFSTFFEAPTAPPSSAGSAARRWIPAMDLVETERDFVLRADLPGLTEADVKIELEDNVLTITGERVAEHEEHDEGYYRVERASGAFARSLTLPEGIDPGAVQANFINGVLEIRIPKPEQRRPRKVAISVGASRPSTIEGSADSGAAEAGGENGSAPSHDPVRAAG